MIESVVPKNLFGCCGNLIPFGPKLFVSKYLDHRVNHNKNKDYGPCESECTLMQTVI